MTEYYSKKCAMCEKEIITHGEECWAYKIKPPKGPMRYFCSYKHMRQYEMDHPETQKQPALKIMKEPKEPQSRMKTAEELTEEIRNGRNPVDFLRKAGYGNPYEAYASVRHYCETKMPDALLTLKPLKNLPRGPQKKTGRPRKTAEVVKEDKEGEAGAVPLVLQGGVNYQLKVDEAVQAEEQSEKTYTANEVLRIVDDATLNCQQVTRFRWTSESLEREMYNNSQLNAEGIGMMKLRREIRKKLGADEE